MIDFTYKTFDEFVALGDGPDIDDVASARVGWNACMAIQPVPTKAALSVLSERARQVEVEGWSTEHDDRHDSCELAAAAACYAVCADSRQVAKLTYDGARLWPGRWLFKPKTYRTNLVRSAALLLAEIERIDRSAKHAPSCGCQSCDVKRNQGIFPMGGL